MTNTRHTITFDEGQRQLTLLALARLAIERPGMNYALSNIAFLMDSTAGGLRAVPEDRGEPQLFARFKELLQRTPGPEEPPAIFEPGDLAQWQTPCAIVQVIERTAAGYIIELQMDIVDFPAGHRFSVGREMLMTIESLTAPGPNLTPHCGHCGGSIDRAGNGHKPACL